MVRFVKALKQTALFSLIVFTLVAYGGSSASAAQTILVNPYDNLPVAGATTLTVTGAGLVPGATVNFRQVATKGLTTGVALEQLHKGSVAVDSNGNFQTTVNVTYDIRSDGPYTVITECKNSDATVYTREGCYLEVFYMEGQGDVPSHITNQKLYFGMEDPNKVTPPPVVVQPLSKEDCREGKWSEFTALAFKNQGACVSFVAKQQ